MKKLSITLLLALLSTSANAQTPVWTQLNSGIVRNVTPNQIGVDIGTSSTNFIALGSIVGGVFSASPPRTTVRGGVYSFTGATSQWAWQLNTDGTWTTKQPSRSDLSDAANVAPHVATISALSASTTAAFPQGVWRDDYSSGLGAGPLFWRPQSGTCTANNAVSDGGSCQNDGAGNSFGAVHPSAGLDVTQFGADRTGVNTSDTAFANAIAAAVVLKTPVVCPPGKYKVTQSIVTPANSTIALKIIAPGGGDSCKITPVFATGQPVISAVLSGLCWHTQSPCLTIDGLYFDAPTGAGANTTDVLKAVNQQYLLFQNNTISGGYRHGVVLETSYSPRILHNFGYNMGGSFLVANTTSDPTMNNARIIDNTVTGSGYVTSGPAMNLGPAGGGQAVGALIEGNNLNGNYGCFLLNGLVATVIRSNFCEASFAYSVIGVSASVPNIGLTFAGNVWSQNPTTNLGGMQKSTFDGENLYNNVFVFNTTSTCGTGSPSGTSPCTLRISVGANNNYAGTSYFSLPTLSGGGSGAAFGGPTPRDDAGIVYGGSTVVPFTITFASPWGYQPICVVQSYDGGTVESMTPSSTSLVVTPGGAAGAHFNYACR